MRLTLLLLVCGTLSMNVLRAGTLIFSNFGSPTAYTTSSYLSPEQGEAIPFTVPSTPDPGTEWALNSVEVVAALSDDTHPIDLTIYSDSNGLPGTALETLDLYLPTGSSSFNDQTISSVENPILVSGSQYWIGLSDPTDPPGNNFVEWAYAGNGTVDPGTVSTFDGTSWSDPSINGYAQGAVQITANEVAASTPEPATFALFGAGLLALGWKRKRG